MLFKQSHLRKPFQVMLNIKKLGILFFEKLRFLNYNLETRIIISDDT